MRDIIGKHVSDSAAAGADPGRIPLIYGPVDGTMKQPKRQELAQEFGEAPCGIYVATMGSAGIAINELSAASCALFVDLHWNPSTLTQAESRIHRDGSPHDAVEIVYLLVNNTVDEMFIQHLTQKAHAAAGIKQGDLVDARLVAELSPSLAETPEESLDYICALLAEGDTLP
jgi:SNF2 family DNA or RNA helicase